MQSTGEAMDRACGVHASSRNYVNATALEAAAAANGYDGVKRVLDILLALPLFVVAAPIVALAGILVKLTSRGPILYSQTRVGRHGRLYTMFKVRTMVHDCERESGPQWCIVGDPRITPLGRFLRRSYIDELPQLWNVLVGDMSLIGPRPERPEFVTQLEQEIPGYRLRLLVRPGLTGLAQVQLPSDTDIGSVRRKLVYDVCYVEQLSAWLDVRILLSTVFHVIGMRFTVARRLLRLPLPELAPATVPSATVAADVATAAALISERPAVEFAQVGAD